jgi:hypothetical protein
VSTSSSFGRSSKQKSSIKHYIIPVIISSLVLYGFKPIWLYRVEVDPKTGEIYAMGASPNFDPNEFNLVKSGLILIEISMIIYHANIQVNIKL